MVKIAVLQSEFMRLRDKYGRLTPDQVVQEARSKTSPLHSQFPWADKVAAHRYRLDIARDLMSRYITIRSTTHKRSITCPIMVRDPELPGNVAGYVSTIEKMDRRKAEAIVYAELDRIESAIHRGRNVADGLDLHNPGIVQKFELLLSTVAQTRELLAAA